MAPQRIKTAELVRVFNSSGRPIYVLDDELSFVFCNEACAEWIGPATGELLGRRCVYRTSPAHGDAATVDALLEGLCPPPIVLSGREAVATVAVPGPDGVPRRRRARFVPVGPTEGEPLVVIGLVEPADLTEADLAVADETFAPTLESAEPDADRLHDQIRRFRQEAAGRYGAERLVGASPAMRLARAQLELAAASSAAVLVVGPVGSGRQHVAHAIHYARDPRREGTLFPVDCAVLGADVIRSTVRALAANPLGDRAARSTLLLADADLMPVEVQDDVAASLASRSFQLRVIATAAAPLTEADPAKVHPQLASLLGTIVIRLPGLTDRREDIPLLAQMFLERANAKATKQLAGFSPETLDRLDAYDWPGNLDELADVVAQAHQQAAGRVIEPGDLPPRLRRAAVAAAHPPREEKTIRLDEFLGKIERELIARAITQAKGNKTKAASLLGMTRPRLYRRMVQLGLEE
ncbi:MAG TPA: helix-turn-helix domain-containing protein [Thermoguttaceae bacterium]|nr:helix-turn-helix domain-containing protein [Thermoguttaceae bacterium]